MSLTYAMRLVCLLAIVAGAANLALQLALSFSKRFLMRRLEDVGSRWRERILYSLQIAPLLLGLLVAGACCLPQYLRYEPTHEPESVGWVTLLLFAALSVWLGAALLRGLRIALRTLSFAHRCRRSGRLIRCTGDLPVFVLAQPVHPLGILGFFSPFIVISADLLDTGGVNRSALQVALDHELAHARHFDNWKLLSLCFLPRLPRDRWLRQWQLAADCAADEDAARSDPARSVLLAEALVRTARFVKPLRPDVICTALTAAETELAVRVDRLLRPRRTSSTAGNSLLLGLAGLLLFAAGGAALATPWIYTASEHILHLGGF